MRETATSTGGIRKCGFAANHARNRSSKSMSDSAAGVHRLRDQQNQVRVARGFHRRREVFVGRAVLTVAAGVRECSSAARRESHSRSGCRQ